MKKILFAALVMAGSIFSAKAQTGSILLYGNLDLTTTKDEGMAFGINPGIGYQFNEHWTAGLNLGVNTADKKYMGGTDGLTAFNVGPFVRYSKSLSNIFSIYGQLQAGYQNNKLPINALDQATSTFTGKGNGFGAQFFPAVFINVKNGFGLNFNFGGINFDSFKQDVPGASSVSSFGVNFGRTFGVGISKNFGGK